MRNPPRSADGASLKPPQVQPNLGCLYRSKRDPRELKTETRRYRLITPLFGGGVIPGEADPVTVIRGSSVRGQLRFWWRACRGGLSGGNLQRMKDQEDEIWGAASTESRPRPAQVQISVVIDDPGRAAPSFRMVPGDKGPQARAEEIAPQYGSFPLQPTKDQIREHSLKAPIKNLHVGVKFALSVTYPTLYEDDVQAALWAWETFGGIGGRTRRGFGSLARTDDARPECTMAAAEETIRSCLKKHVLAGTWPEGTPHLDENMEFVVTGRCQEPDQAWKFLIGKLKAFRQWRGSETKPNPRGRSRWPEPDEIRRLRGQVLPRHSAEISGIQKFPRAVFGLPITFHFKDDKAGDPGDTTLQGKEFDRLASPLLLRPIKCKDGSVGLAALLETPLLPPGGLILKGARGNPPVDATLTPEDVKSLPMLKPAPMTPFDGEKVVLRAFLAFLKTSETEKNR